MSDLVGSDGIRIPEGSQQSIVYNGSEIDYIDYICSTGTYRQTFTYSGGKVTAISIPTLQA